MSLESPLAKILGHGSAKGGTDHWWSQRVTAVALVPLSLWFVFALLGLSGFDYASVHAWLREPLNAVLLVLLLITLLYHSKLGLQVVVEDYVHSGLTKVPLLMLLQFAHVVLGVAGIYSIIIISTGSAA